MPSEYFQNCSEIILPILDFNLIKVCAPTGLYIHLPIMKKTVDYLIHKNYNHTQFLWAYSVIL